MSKPYFKTLLKKNENINLYEDTREKLPAGRKGRFYLWDKYCGMNLAMGGLSQKRMLLSKQWIITGRN